MWIFCTDTPFRLYCQVVPRRDPFPWLLHLFAICTDICPTYTSTRCCFRIFFSGVVRRTTIISIHSHWVPTLHCLNIQLDFIAIHSSFVSKEAKYPTPAGGADMRQAFIASMNVFGVATWKALYIINHSADIWKVTSRLTFRGTTGNYHGMGFTPCV